MVAAVAAGVQVAVVGDHHDEPVLALPFRAGGDGVDEAGHVGVDTPERIAVLLALDEAVGVAGVVGVLTFLGSLSSLGAGFGLFQIAALCVAAVYLAGPRTELRLLGRGGPSHYGY